MNIRTYRSVLDRRRALEKELKVHLNHIGSFSVDESVAASRNCENMIGAAQVPMGIAGPLRIRSVRAPKETKEYYLPLATTEGALVASVSRGCKAITQSGGGLVDSYRIGATRGPVFRVNNLIENDRLNTFLDEHLDEFKTIAAKTSHHLKLKKFIARGVGRYRFVRFSFDTSDAMGMNMVTIATTAITRYIEEKTGATCVSVAGNFDVDKKPAWLNVVENRGFKAWAEATITKNVLEEVLKTTAQRVYNVWLSKCMIGSAISGSMGFNAQFANVVAAIFIATGQDPAHVAEGSVGITTAEVIDNDLYVSVYLPDLMVGTVGGGTGLATQSEALRLLHVTKSQELAEVIAGAVLAGEISLLASLSEGTLAQSHQKLARGGK